MVPLDAHVADRNVRLVHVAAGLVDHVHPGRGFMGRCRDFSGSDSLAGPALGERCVQPSHHGRRVEVSRDGKEHAPRVESLRMKALHALPVDGLDRSLCGLDGREVSIPQQTSEFPRKDAVEPIIATSESLKRSRPRHLQPVLVEARRLEHLEVHAQRRFEVLR